MKTKLLSIIDKRTTVTMLVNIMLFILAYRSEKIALASLDAITYITIALVGSSAATRGMIAIATQRGKRGLKAPKEKE